MSMTMDRFLTEARLVHDRTTLREIRDNMRASIERGLGDESGCLRMIPAYVPPCEGQLDGEVVALDAGGTNVRAARVRFQPDEEPVILDAQRAPLPGGDGTPVDGRTFFGSLADLVAGTGGGELPVGFVFSYPTRILPDRDGVLLRWTKEVKADDVVGRRVGQGLGGALKSRHALKPGAVTVLNDTVAALAAGSTRMSGTGGAIGLIVGTGTNMAYFEQSAAITKLPEEEAGPAIQAINMESGNFDGLPLGCFDRALDDESGDPGRQRMEKQVGGRYVGELCRRVLRGAVGKQLLTPVYCERMAEPWTLETATVAAALDEDEPRFEGPLAVTPEDERERVTQLLRAVVTRAADIVAAGLAAVIDHLGLAAAPVAIVAEGTMFWKMPGFSARLEQTLDELAPALGSTPRYMLLNIDEANLIGAAAAALS